MFCLYWRYSDNYKNKTALTDLLKKLKNQLIHFELAVNEQIKNEGKTDLNNIDNDSNYLEQVKASKYEGHLESKERLAIKKYLLIIGKKKNMQVLSHTFTYFST